MRCRRRARRVGLCLAVFAFLVLQVAFFTFLIQEQDAVAEAMAPLFDLRIPAVLTAMPAEEESAEVAPPSMPPLNAAQPGSFGLNTTHEEGVILLRSCIGKGTFGSILNATTPSGEVIVKVPLFRHWGLRYYEMEQRALRAVNGVGGSRHVVRLVGNATIATNRLLHLGEFDLGGSTSSSDSASREQDGMTAERWSCLNTTDLRMVRDVLGFSRVPVLLLESLEDLSLFKVLASIAAPPDTGSGTPASLEYQRRVFRAQLAKEHSPTAQWRESLRFMGGLLLGVSRGIAALHRAHVVHRDLTEPGKNVMLKRDALGLTAGLIDLSQAEICPPGRGAMARAVDMCTHGPRPPRAHARALARLSR